MTTAPKTPIVLPTPKVAGVTPTVPPKANNPVVAPAPSVPKSEYPKDLPNGDILLGEAKNYLGNHVMQMIERKDPSQFFPLFAKCSCGTEGRFYAIDSMQRFVETHMLRHPR